MKKSMLFGCLLTGSTLAAQQVCAAEYLTRYHDDEPSKAKLTLSLSGDCTGKINLPITQIHYYVQYGDGTAPGLIDIKASTMANFALTTSDSNIYLDNIYSYTDSRGDKLSDQVKKGKRSIKFTTINNSHYAKVIFTSLSSNAYAPQIKCKDGNTLKAQMLSGWTPFFDNSGIKTNLTLSHTNLTSEPEHSSYKAKYSAIGYLQMPSECKQAGLVTSDDYKLSCAASRKIKLSIKASAEGSASLVP